MKNTINVPLVRMIGLVTLAVMITFAMTACGGGSSDPALTGTIVISPAGPFTMPDVQKLTATYSGTEAVSFQWKRGTTNVGTASTTNPNEYTPDQAGSYTVTVSASGFQSKTSTAVVVNGGSGGGGELTGTVSISGSAVEGQVLTAVTTELGGSGAITYQWKRTKDGATNNIGTNSATYTVTAADVGYNISVTVTRAGYTGSKTSDMTGAVTGQPEYGASLNPSTDFNFDNDLAGRSEQTHTVTVTNIGKQATGVIYVTITGGDAGSFELGENDDMIASLQPGGTATFTIMTTKNAKAGQNRASVNVTNGSGVNSFSETFLVTFTAARATVTFNTGGGGAVDPQGDKAYGDKVTKPANPARNSYEFVGWYKEAEFAARWDFENDTVSDDTTLYARWIAANQVNGTEGLAYTLINNGTEYSVAGGTASGTVTIPAYARVDENSDYLPVTAIANSAFYGTGITTVNIPAGITTIGTNAFRYSSVREIRVDPNNPNYTSRSIGSVDIVFSKDMTTLLFAAPGGPTGTLSVTIPDSVTEISAEAFYGVQTLAGVTIPAGVTSIGSGAFQYCGYLRIVTFQGANTAIANDNCFPDANAGSLKALYEDADTGGIGTYTRTHSSPTSIPAYVPWVKQP